MRQRSLAVFALLVIGCLPAFAPNLRARGVHAGATPTAANETCMDCHVSEHDAMHQPGTVQAAPIVADWMVTESRACTDCHRVSTPRVARTASVRVGVHAP